MYDLSEFIELFLNYLLIEKKYSKNTIKSYETDLIDFKDFIKNKKINKIDVNDIKNYINYLNKNKLSEKSVAHHITVLRSFYKFLLVSAPSDLQGAFDKAQGVLRSLQDSMVQGKQALRL